MTAPRPWTGWSRSRNAVSPLPRLRPPTSGNGKRLNIIDTPGPRRLHHRSRAQRCACSTAAVLPCSTAMPGVEPQTETSGVRPTVTPCRASCSSTRWTRSAPTLKPAGQVSSCVRSLGAQGRCSDAAADRTRRTTLTGVVDLVTHGRRHLVPGERRLGEPSIHRGGDPRRHEDQQAQEARDFMVENCVERGVDVRCDAYLTEAILEDRVTPDAASASAIRKGTCSSGKPSTPVMMRLRLQEQGRCSCSSTASTYYLPSPER